jgi:ABC-type Mn2+/Zn2+ transport system permease subunit
MEFLTDPWSWWVEPFTGNAFMLRALTAGLLTVVATSVVGTWLVLRGMTYLGDALAHGVLPGIAMAYVFGGSTTLGALLAALVMVGGIHVVRQHSPLPDDVSIGLLFVAMLALTVVIVSRSARLDITDLEGFLFGSVMSIESADLWRQAVSVAVTLVGAALFHRSFLVLTLDETQAALLGLRPRLAHLALLVLVAVSIVAAFEVVGSMLVFAFLVAPPATATLLVRRVPLVMLTAVGLGSVAVLLGALISYHGETAAGATMALVSVGLFCVVLVGQVLAGRRDGDPQTAN